MHSPFPHSISPEHLLNGGSIGLAQLLDLFDLDDISVTIQNSLSEMLIQIIQFAKLG